MHADRSRKHVTVFVAFSALAVLAGPIHSYAAAAFDAAMNFQQPAGAALSSLLAGVVLLLLSAARRQPMLRPRQWLALLALLLPQWLALPLTAPYTRALSWLHPTSQGIAFLPTLAAPLWLALLAALELVRTEVPRATVGAVVVAMGAVYLVIPVDATRVTWDQAPALVLQLILNIAMVASWAYAAPRLADSEAAAGTLAVAGWFLLLSALGDGGLAALLERSAWQPVDRHEVWLPLLAEAAVTAASCWLWFWLLQRMTLAAFSMRALAAWVASILPGLVAFGFMNWRIDAALVLSLAAIVVALRARPAEEQPLALGLRSG